MKKYFLLYKVLFLSLPGFAQLTIGSGVQWVTTGNASVVLQDMNLVNDGSISSGTGSFKFTGTLNSAIGGSTMPSFNILEMAKTNAAKVLLGRNISIGSSINFISGQLDLNNNNILMSAIANIAGESETNRIIGPSGGFVEVTQNMNAPVSLNAGNLGATITSAANLGSVTIRRGHIPQSGTGLSNSINRYYSIVPTNNSSLNATLRLRYFDAEMNGQTEAGLVMYQSVDNGANWNNLSQTSRNTNSNYVEKTGVASLALQTLANDVAPSAPVTGLTFSGTRKKATEVQVNWTTATETNMSGFEVQRKLDNEISFAARIFVNTKAPGGNSLSQLSYSYIDANSYTGTSYYRLKIIDKANNISYSNEISIVSKTKGGKGGGNNLYIVITGEESAVGRVSNANSLPINAKVTIGPNPNHGNFWFKVSGIEKETVANLFTIDGKLIKQFRVINLQQQPVNGMTSGIYLLKVPGFETQKIVVTDGRTVAPQSRQITDNNKF